MAKEGGKAPLKTEVKENRKVHANKSDERERDQKLVLEQAREAME